MDQKMITRFQCPVCKKVTAGRLPFNGDGTFWFPRRHKGPDGQPCPGNIEEAIYIDVPAPKKRAKKA